MEGHDGETTSVSSYAYAVALPVTDRGILGDLRGVGDAPVELLVSAGLMVAVSHVAAGDFDEDALRARLEDLDWLEGTARAHNAVVDALAAHTSVLPLRLATVYLSDDRLMASLSERRQTLIDRLNALAGNVELGVKVYALPSQEGPKAAAASGAATSRASSGRAYLRERRRSRDSREDAWQAAARLASRLDDVVGDVSQDTRRHRPQQGTLATGPGENVVNASYLVAADSVEEFRRRVESLTRQADGVRVDMTGPWAPYSFATVPDLPGATGTSEVAP